MAIMVQITKTSDELLPGDGPLDKTHHVHPEAVAFSDVNTNFSDTPVVPMPATVSIGASNDEEEIELQYDPSQNACADVEDDRNDLESRDEDYAIASTSIRSIEASNDSSIGDESESASEQPETKRSIKDNLSRVKFGTHMIRDSVITNENPIKPEESQEIGRESCYNLDNSNGKNIISGSNELRLSCSQHATKYTTDKLSVQERPVKSILKIQDDSSTQFPRYTRQVRKLLRGELKLPTRSRKKHAVTFSSITLRTYDIILGDHPNCKFGAPISIGWDYHECNVLPIDLYEKCRDKRRKMKKLYLNSGRRRKLLERAGYFIEDISEAINDVQMVQLQRQESSEDVNDPPTFMRQTTNQLQHISMKGWKKKASWSRMLKMLPSGMRRSKF